MGGNLAENDLVLYLDEEVKKRIQDIPDEKL